MHFFALLLGQQHKSNNLPNMIHLSIKAKLKLAGNSQLPN